ncbi:hypothetical protein FNH13_03735 [Ornithinimicrobium ciconiae]|uniref:Uncharacterized protein n=1 Tax=Ornithinimicrobium ciconiae TaxID=2594265 RepID=A0A516G7Q0_9MICO|nr:hypothetical protein [Ornithinimicrobium ciconiae]QDO87557.1 hypothetical protein FNH13_03735 [Ornithinimicrobium ciconiae]
MKITATLVLGGETFRSIRDSAKIVSYVPGAMALSAALVLVSLYFTLRAAHGPACLDTKIRETLEQSSDRDMRRAGAAAASLKGAQWLLPLAVLLFLAALVTMWSIAAVARESTPDAPERQANAADTTPTDVLRDLHGHPRPARPHTQVGPDPPDQHRQLGSTRQLRNSGVRLTKALL